MKICKLPIAGVRYDKTSYFYMPPFFSGASWPPLTFSFRGPTQILGALGYWAHDSLFPWPVDEC